MYKLWLIDINPWIPVCVDSLLFSWEELQKTKEILEFRVIKDQSMIQPTDTHGYKVPIVRIPCTNYSQFRILKTKKTCSNS